MSVLNVYFHKDFDGFVAAALFLRINEESQLIGTDSPNLNAVDYSIKETWLKTKLSPPNVVIDFLYHPKAEWWFDHHVSTFLYEKHEKKYRNSEKQHWNIKSPSCATLIKDNLQQNCSLFMSSDDYNRIVDSFNEWIYWSDIIDNAKYESPAQVVELNHPCLQINETLTGDVEDNYICNLVSAAKLYLPEEVICLRDIKGKIDNVLRMRDNNLKVFKNEYKVLSQDIVLFDYVENEIPFQRYMTYYYEPEASYSIGLYKRNGTYSISVGKNPWREFESVNIGEICRKYGGGGRENVGSVIVNNYSNALDIVNEIQNTLK